MEYRSQPPKKQVCRQHTDISIFLRLRSNESEPELPFHNRKLFMTLASEPIPLLPRSRTLRGFTIHPDDAVASDPVLPLPRSRSLQGVSIHPDHAVASDPVLPLHRSADSSSYKHKRIQTGTESEIMLIKTTPLNKKVLPETQQVKNKMIQ
ncbi:hypothetical protein CHS0354_034212 [Potamilus streckersoni]|uniref:Uncharacterized protein n=1 Tax=Potamilus streckersoni TaxID=2493646 RepID=A0AAE0W6W4_9BIVA|nr:hypothetical protein CHS0354_034212 [Potamilus streckersoni]